MAGSSARSPSSPKRGHEDDADEQLKPASKKARQTDEQSAQVEAQQPQQPTLDGTSLPNTDNARAQAEHGEQSEDRKKRFPVPADGEPGQYAEWLFNQEKDLAAPFKEWCLRQLVAKSYRTMGDLEDLAEALQNFYYNTRLDHDWGNEQDIPFLPMRL